MYLQMEMNGIGVIHLLEFHEILQLTVIHVQNIGKELPADYIQTVQLNMLLNFHYLITIYTVHYLHHL